MRINWIVASDLIIDPTVDVNALKKTGKFWGSWSSWHACKTNNIICHDKSQAATLIRKNFHRVADTLFLPESFKTELGTVTKVVYYCGEFSHEIDNREEIVAMHLAGNNSDIVLLYGFDWSAKPPSDDSALNYRQACYNGLASEAIKSLPHVQWVLVDHGPELAEEFRTLENLSIDTLENVQKLLIS